jgi:anti-sigma regulatory factor (Ser/Thr protein kinase)
MPDQTPPGRATHVVAAPEAVRQLADVLDAFCARERVPDQDAWKLRVALDEVIANIVAHGATGEGRPEIDVSFSRRGDVVEIVVEDTGRPFDPMTRPPPDPSLPLESRQPGGLGIALLKSLMDDVGYERTTRNVLTLRKIIRAAGAET